MPNGNTSVLVAALSNAICYLDQILRVKDNVLSESPLYHNFGYIFLGFSPFPRRTHRVCTAGMSLSKKNLSQNSCIKRLRENMIK